jgi:hypothetical protein
MNRPHVGHAALQRTCPSCEARPGQLCKTRNGKSSPYFHSIRSRPAESSLPDLSQWYRDMAPFEGQHARPRPADLVVP